MAASTHVYAHAVPDMAGGVGAGTSPNIDWLSDSIYIALVNAYTPNQSAHEFWSDVVANEVPNGSGYTTNGIVLTGKTLAVASLVATFDSSLDPTWSGATFTATHAIIYDRTPASDATRPLIAYIDFGGALSPVSGSLVIQFNASGILTATVS